MARPPARARIKKRLFVIAGIAFAIVALLAGLLSWMLSSLIGPANYYRFQIDTRPDQQNILGSGINLEQAPPSNFIRDGSFEPIVFKNALTLFGGYENTLTVSSEEASAGLFGDGFFNGATARILSDSDGGMTLKKTATVTHYGINRIGLFQPLVLPTDILPGRATLDFVRKGQQSMAVGRDGLVIRNVTGQTLQSGNSGLTSDLTGVCATSNGFVAVSDRGDVIQSPDGMAWKSWRTDGQARFNAVAASDRDLIAAVGMEGAILIGSDGFLSSVQSGTANHLRSVAFGQSAFIAAGEGGALLRSPNGLVWEPIAGTPDSDWHSVIFQDGRFLVVGTNGKIGLSDDGRYFSFMTVDSALDYVDAVMLSVQQLILLDSEGRFYISNDSGRNWQKSGIETGMVSRRIDLIGKDRILSADDKGSLGQAQIVAEIILDSAITGEPYQAGDMCFLEIGKTTVPENYLGSEATQARQSDPWQIMGKGTGLRTKDEASPAGGSASMKLVATDEGTNGSEETTILTQQIDPSLILSKPKNQVYRIELFMRQEQIASRSIVAWISGPFTSVGTRFDNVGSAFRKYTFTFVLPTDAIREQDEIRFNMAFAGSGTLLVDRVYFGPSTDPYAGLDKSLAETVIAAAPAVIRLPLIGIGSRTIASDAFSWPSGNAHPGLSLDGFRKNTVLSAATALDICIKAGASPYLVIGSFGSETDVLNLMEYLCAPISETYGKLRMDNGRVAPYSDAFNRILIEIHDPDDLFSGDQRKAAFVNQMIRTIEQSPYYRLVKGKLVFVDGMEYQDGVLLSRADYHASSLTAVLSDDPIHSANEAYLSYLDRIPRTPDRSESLPSEIMRSARMDTQTGLKARMADLAYILLRDLGEYTSLTCLEITSGSEEAMQPYVNAVREISAAAKGMALAVSPMSDTSAESGTQSAELFSDSKQGQPVQVYAFSSEQTVTVVLINQGQTPAIVQLSTMLPITPATITKFDETGLLLSTQRFRSPTSRINLMPGGIAVIRSDAEPDK